MYVGVCTQGNALRIQKSIRSPVLELQAVVGQLPFGPRNHSSALGKSRKCFGLLNYSSTNACSWFFVFCLFFYVDNEHWIPDFMLHMASISPMVSPHPQLINHLLGNKDNTIQSMMNLYKQEFSSTSSREIKKKKKPKQSIFAGLNGDG